MSDRGVNLLVGAFVALAVLIIGFAIFRSRSAPSADGAPDHTTTAATSSGFDVVRILDGDTLVIIGDDQIELTLRLAGIDSPETNQQYGGNATEFLTTTLEGKTVRLDNVRREKFGRVLADAYVDSRWVNLELVQHGFAWVYPDSNSRALRDAEADARTAGAGLWANGAAVPPWEWRKDQSK